jgi:hypothetical protein
VREDENELIHNAISSDCPADQFQGCVLGIIEDEVIQVKVT